MNHESMTNSKIARSQTSESDLVITGLGMLTANGLGIDTNLNQFELAPSKFTQEDFKVKGFNPAPHLSDRKVVKVVSHRDVLGLVAFEECLKNSGLSPKTINPDRTGLYVGAPPSSCMDHHNYHEGIESSVDAYGQLQEKEFGENFRSASPTTLLTGLPNNVLCYGAKTLDARGPNSNYTTMETSAHMAIIGAQRAIKLGRLDCAVAGGYSAHSDKVFVASATQRGIAAGAPFAEGAVFITMETRKNATRRGAKPICTLLSGLAGSDSMGPYNMDANAATLTILVQTCITNAAIQPSDVGIVMLSGSGIASVDQAEMRAISNTWGHDYRPVLATTSSRWGQLMEAGGTADIGFLQSVFKTKKVPDSAAWGSTASQSIDKNKRYAVIIRSSPFGEYTCLVVRMEEE
jgi:3-oxoacyl-(acyl-carrier-protein) synthase